MNKVKDVQSKGSGKSSWLLKFLQNQDVLLTSRFQRIIYAYSKSDKTRTQQKFLNLLENLNLNVEICEGMPDIGAIVKTGIQTLLVRLH